MQDKSFDAGLIGLINPPSKFGNVVSTKAHEYISNKIGFEQVLISRR